MKRRSPPGARKPSNESPAARSPIFTPPYPPSWLDRLNGWVDRLPFPWWLFYVLLGLAAILATQALQRSSGDYVPGRYLVFHWWFSGYFAYLLGLAHTLDRSAEEALRTFRPVLHFDGKASDWERSYQDLRYRLTTLPPRSALAGAALGMILGTLLPLLVMRLPSTNGGTLEQAALLFGFSAKPFPLTVMLIQATFATAVTGTFVYHTFHQLRLIDRVYRRFARLNLYRLQPLYAFSTTTSLTAIGLAVFNYGWYGSAPALLEQPISLWLGAFFLSMTVVVFVWPLLGAHRRLVVEKRRLLAESAKRFETAVGLLHQAVDRARLTQMDDLNRTLASLELEQAAVRRVPTWPWEPGTLRNLLAAILLPIFIWLVQFGLERVLGG